MKKYLLALFISISFSQYSSTKYYLSLSGNDSNTGTVSTSPWLTITKLNTVTFVPGDTVFFRCGDTFKGTIKIGQSGNSSASVVFTSYGAGAKPIISGAEAVSNWTLSGPATYGNIFQATFTQTPIHFFSNGHEKVLARYPNDHDYLTLDNTTTLTLVDASLLSVGAATINNSQICIHTRQWCWEKSAVSSLSGSTITLTTPLQQTGLTKYGYFLYDNILHLDTINEWKYDGAAQKINYVVAAGQSPTLMTCEASVASYSNGVEFGSLVKYIKFNNLSFEKQSNAGINIASSSNQYIIISNCDFARQYNYGVNDKGRYNEIGNCYFREIDGLPIYLNGAGRKSTVHHNVLRNNGQIRNSGIGQEINATSIFNSSSDSCYIHHNDIDSAGYCGISVDAGNAVIEKNVIKNAIMCNNDGAAYKSWGPNATNNIIQNNFAIGSNGNTEGTFQADFLTPGIYFDFFVNNCNVKNNTIYGHSGRGIFQNSANHHNAIIGNVVYGTDYCLDLNGSSAQTVAINNMTVKRNSFFALNNTAYIIKQVDGINNYTVSQGYIDSNYYFQPYNSAKIGYRLINNVTPTSYSFAAWQATGYDQKTKKSFVNWTLPTNNSTLVTNMTDNVNTYTLNGLYLDLDSNNVCNSITLQPYTSKILINTLQNCVSGIQENKLENGTIVFPNPSSNFIIIKNENSAVEIRSITITDITGKMVKTYCNLNDQEQIDVSDLKNGVYLVTITDSNKNKTTSKIIINQ